MSLMAIEAQRAPKGRDTSHSKSLLDLKRLPRLRFSSPSKRHTDDVSTSAMLSTLPVAPSDAVFNKPTVNTDSAVCTETTNSPASQVIAGLVTIPASIAPHTLQVEESTTELEDRTELCSLNSAVLQRSDIEVPTNQPSELPSKSPVLQHPDTQVLRSQPPELQSNSTVLQQSNIEVLSNQPSEQQSSKFERLEVNCYAANNMQLDPGLQEIFDKTHRRRISGKLRRLKLSDPRISLEFAMVGPECTSKAMKPTILCMCFTEDQRKAIIKAFKQKDSIPVGFDFKVVTYEIKKSSAGHGPPHHGPTIGQKVEIILPKHLATLCGTQARISLNDQSSNYARSTIGGLIVINKTLYALTTAHGFATASNEGARSDERNIVPEMNITDSTISAQIFALLGTIYSFVWTDDSPIDELEEPESNEDTPGQDWALVDVQPQYCLENSFLFCDEKIDIDGYIRDDNLTYGEVYVCTGSSGIQKGILSGSTASIIMGTSLFDVRPISLERELADGDSGSWVIREGKLCGYIFCRVVGLPRAFMFPIESAFKEIAQTLPDLSLIHMDVPSRKSIDEINQSKKGKPLPALSKKPTSTAKQDHSLPNINARDPYIKRQDVSDFVSPGASLSSPRSDRYDLPRRDDSNASRDKISAASGTPLYQPRPFVGLFTPTASSRHELLLGQADQSELFSPLDPSPVDRSAKASLSNTLRSKQSIHSRPSIHQPRHPSILEEDIVEMDYIGNQYRRMEEYDEREERLGSISVDMAPFAGLESSYDAATVLKFHKLEHKGQLTGGLGSGLKPEVIMSRDNLFLSAKPLPKTSRWLLSRALRNGSMLNRRLTQREIGQRVANLTGKIIKVVADDGVDDGVDEGGFYAWRYPQARLELPKKIYYPQPKWIPHSMRWPYLTGLIAVSITLAVVQEFIYQKSKSLASQDPPSGLIQFIDFKDLSAWDYFMFKYLPTMITVAYSILWQVTDSEVKRLEPFHRLSKDGGALAAESINVDYITISSIFRPLRALRYKHWAVAVSSFATLLSVFIVPTLQTASIVLEPDIAARMQNPGNYKYINIHAELSRFLTAVLGTISTMGIVLLIILQRRRSGLAGDVRGIAGIVAMATKSHVLMDFKDLDTVPPNLIHEKLKNRRYSLRNSSLASDNVSPTNHKEQDKYNRYHDSTNSHPFMLRLKAGAPFIISMIAFTIFMTIVTFLPVNIIFDKAGWLLTLLAISIKICFQHLEQQARFMEPFYRLSRRHAPPKVLTLDYTSMVFGYMPIRAALNGDFLIAFVGLGSVLAEILIISVASCAVINTSISSSIEVPKSLWVSSSLSIFILLYLIITASFVYKLRRHPILPRQPSTIASVLAFVHQSKMLWDFVVPFPGSSILTRQESYQDQLVKRLTSMGKTYGFGWFTGRDGEIHCGVDQEELKGLYQHKTSGDARMALMTAPELWDM